MKPIAHHASDRTDLLAVVRKLLERGLDVLISTSETPPLPTVVRNSVWIVGTLAALDPGSDELCTARAERKTDPGPARARPTGMPSLAHDLGIAVEVESDYLPRRLVGRGCGVGCRRRRTSSIARSRTPRRRIRRRR